MYVGEVNVVQEKLSGLIKAAECLRIKGLAVPDEEPSPTKQSSREKRTIDNSISSDPKRRRQDDSERQFIRQTYANGDDMKNKLNSSDSSIDSRVPNPMDGQPHSATSCAQVKTEGETVSIASNVRYLHEVSL